MTAPAMREAFAASATDMLASDPLLALVLSDISVQYFAAAAAQHPDRVINVGIREQLAVNVGAGLALTGMRPIVHTIASFLVERSFEQIKLGFGHQDVGGVLVSVGASYDISVGGRTHQAPGDVALLDTLGDWEVHVPGHADELVPLLQQAVTAGGRAYVRATTQSNATARPVGKLHLVRRGSGGTVLAVGPLLDPVLEAVAELDVTVLYASTVRPLDTRSLLATLSDPAVVALVEPYAEGTSAWVVSKALAHVPHRLLTVGVPREEWRRYGTPAEHAAAHGLDAAGLRRKISAFVRG